ncbi:hypothetical protein VOLCADRAFT_104942 [Volvox carteri f. nagariensis]|uniref:Uncharacterized protein n=1 Tax=Volvox carteri f. nagariensis TaxID=3068 RepID=D8TXB0_VOLCA|nr:uncharacterized protein VOLCADRAFT_104942 [Volvox carteri f. nagariensis]EFJ47880.1 hypothetical protein VOLCADRAFT_104942 [Volvox carteri f. nagariensis]|eukprot:XP_002950986.1 hypothetical protein VOLCADRAFT_104942 [Volvox carteri f. nagariensis]
MRAQLMRPALAAASGHRLVRTKVASGLGGGLLCPLARRRPMPAGLVRSSSPETEEARSPLDAPQEWEAPMPSKRPDIFPEFEKPQRVFLPKPLPGDPEMPDEELEESAKRTTPGDPDPEQKPGEPPEEPEKPAEPGQPEPERKTDIPTVPEQGAFVLSNYRQRRHLCRRRRVRRAAGGLPELKRVAIQDVERLGIPLPSGSVWMCDPRDDARETRALVSQADAALPTDLAFSLRSQPPPLPLPVWCKVLNALSPAAAFTNSQRM